MKKMLVMTLSVGVLFICSSFSKIHYVGNVPSGVFKIMEVTYLWELLQSDYQADYDRDHTWVESGLRSKYAMAKNYASLGIVERAFGQKIFLSGPHGSDMNFTSTTSFGHYNPSFVSSLHNTVKTILGNPTYRKAAQYVYDNYLSGTMHSYAEAYKYLDQNPGKKEQLKAFYLKELANPNGTTKGSLLNQVGEFAQENPELDVFEAHSAPSFWIRRSIDGTDDAFAQLLNFIFEELD